MDASQKGDIYHCIYGILRDAKRQIKTLTKNGEVFVDDEDEKDFDDLFRIFGHINKAKKIAFDNEMSLKGLKKP